MIVNTIYHGEWWQGLIFVEHFFLHRLYTSFLKQSMEVAVIININNIREVKELAQVSQLESCLAGFWTPSDPEPSFHLYASIFIRSPQRQWNYTFPPIFSPLIIISFLLPHLTQNICKIAIKSIARIYEKKAIFSFYILFYYTSHLYPYMWIYLYLCI